MLPFFWLTLLGGTSISAGIQKEIVTITSSVSLLKKVLKTVKESDKKSYSLREISKEINLPEYTIRRYISLNKLTVESESNSDNPRKIGYKISKESLLDFLTFNEDDLIKAMDKVKRTLNLSQKIPSTPPLKTIGFPNVMIFHFRLKN